MDDDDKTSDERMVDILGELEMRFWNQDDLSAGQPIEDGQRAIMFIGILPGMEGIERGRRFVREFVVGEEELDVIRREFLEVDDPPRTRSRTTRRSRRRALRPTKVSLLNPRRAAPRSGSRRTRRSA